MIDRVLSHGFAGAEEVSPSEKSDGIGDGAEVGSMRGAGGGRGKHCHLPGEPGSRRFGSQAQSDTNEANFDAHVINSQTPEMPVLRRESGVGAGLDSVVGMHVLSPDLVCPDTSGCEEWWRDIGKPAGDL